MTAKGSTQGKVSSTFWRFLALTDPTVTRVICRDTDARLSNRDKAAVEEWITSGYYFHMMHDHPYHGGHPVLAGMFGSVNGLLNPKLIQRWFQKDQDVAIANETGPPSYHWWADQDWLKETVWPLVANYTLSHSSFSCGKFGEAKTLGFPLQRVSAMDFVGNVHRQANLWQGERLPDSGTTCPLQCRRKPDWTTC